MSCRTEAILTACADDRVWVRPGVATLCEGCRERGGCRWMRGVMKVEEAEIEIPISAPNNALPGDQVTVVLQANTLLRAAWFMYGLPLVVLIVVMLLGQYMGWSEGLTLLAAIGLSGVTLRVISGRARLELEVKK